MPSRQSAFTLAFARKSLFFAHLAALRFLLLERVDTHSDVQRHGELDNPGWGR